MAEQCRWGFKQSVAGLLGMDATGVQAMVLLGVPNCAIEHAECAGQVTFTLTEPYDGLTFLQTAKGGAVVYSKAHISKVWTFEATALADARHALLTLRKDKRALAEKQEQLAALRVEDAEDMSKEVAERQKKLKDGQTEDQIERAIQELVEEEGTSAGAMEGIHVPPSERPWPHQCDHYIDDRWRHCCVAGTVGGDRQGDGRDEEAAGREGCSWRASEEREDRPADATRSQYVATRYVYAQAIAMHNLPKDACSVNAPCDCCRLCTTCVHQSARL